MSFYDVETNDIFRAAASFFFLNTFTPVHRYLSSNYGKT